MLWSLRSSWILLMGPQTKPRILCLKNTPLLQSQILPDFLFLSLPFSFPAKLAEKSNLTPISTSSHCVPSATLHKLLPHGLWETAPATSLVTYSSSHPTGLPQASPYLASAAFNSADHSSFSNTALALKGTTALCIPSDPSVHFFKRFAQASPFSTSSRTVLMLHFS